MLNVGVWKRILKTPHGLIISLCILFLGVLQSGVTSLQTIAISEGAGLDKGGVAVYAALNALFGIAVTLGSGYVSDGKISRHRLVAIGGAIGAIGYVGIAVSRSPLAVFPAGLLSVFIGVLFPQLFAVAREGLLNEWPMDEQNLAITCMRTLFSLGFIFGTAIASALTRFMPVNVIFFLLAAGALVVTGFSTFSIRRVGHSQKEKADLPLIDAVEKQNQPKFDWVLFTLVLSSIVILRGSDSARSVYLPLVMKNMFGDPGIAPIMLGITATAELVTMSVAAVVAMRIGERATIILGALIGAAYFVTLALVNSLATLYAVQLVYALFVAALFGVAMAYVQSLLADRAGLGASVYMSSLNLGAMVGILSPLVIPGVSQSLFFAPAALCLIGAVLMFVTDRIQRPSLVMAIKRRTAV